MTSEPVRREPDALRVVIVDADRRVRRDLAHLLDLGERSVVVGVADDAPTALALVERVGPDVVVLDPRLPDVEAGLALVARLRRDSPARIVILGNDGSLAPRAKALGADEFVTKGGQLSTLLDAIVRPVRGPDTELGSEGDPDD